MRLSKYKNKIFSIIILLVIFSFSVSFAFAASDQAKEETKKGIGAAGTTLTDFGKEGGYATTGNKANLDAVIGSVIQYVLSFLGVIFLTLMVYAGFNWMKARGDSDAVTKAKDTMINATIGLAITLAAYALTFWIVGSLTGATLG